LIDDIKKYVLGCELCQLTKPDQQKKTNTLHPNEVTTQLWDIISINIVGPLPTSSRYNGILVTVDQFSKMACYSHQYRNLFKRSSPKVVGTSVQRCGTAKEGY